MRTAKKFTNFTDQDFTFAWDSVEYSVKAHESMNLPDFLADHAAKHLVDREMMKDSRLVPALYSDISRAPFLAKCLDVMEEVSDNEVAAEVASLNQPTPVEETEEAPLGLTEEPTEEVFEGLNENEDATPTV